MIYLDTHVVVWMYRKDKDRFSPEALRILNSDEPMISPIVELEIEYLFETERISVRAKTILDYLEERIGLKRCTAPFTQVIEKAVTQTWTRDPFDRIITAQASVSGSVLLTKDTIIRKHYAKAVW